MGGRGRTLSQGAAGRSGVVVLAAAVNRINKKIITNK